MPTVWTEVDWDAEPDWDWRSAADDTPDQLYALWREAVARSRVALVEALERGGLDQPVTSMTTTRAGRPTCVACCSTRSRSTRGTWATPTSSGNRSTGSSARTAPSRSSGRLSVPAPRVEGMTNAPIILVPGFWLGAWAWDEVAEHAARRRPRRHRADACPGSSRSTPTARRSRSHDHVDAICDAVRAAGAPVVLAVHSGAGVPGYAATDRVPELIAHMVYVDTGPATAAMDPDIEGDEYPLPSARGARGEREPRRAQRRAARDVPQPGRARAGRRAARRARAHERRAARRAEHADRDRLHVAGLPRRRRGGPGRGSAGLNDLRNVAYVDLPTSHWPMWSRPKELAEIIGGIASGTTPST